MRHSWRDVLSALVALSLAVPTCAAPVDGEAAAARKEDLEFLYQTLERARPDLFANTPEERFLERKAAIETGLEEADDFTFALELQSLTALAGDSHTTLALGGSMSQTVHYYPMSLLHRDGSWYLSAVPAEHRALLGREITAVNGRSMEEIVEAFAAQVERDLSAGEYRRVVVDLRNNGGGSDGVKVLDKVSFIVGHGDKIAFVGDNENAHTALFKILAGEMEPDEGTVKWGQTATFSYFPKDNTPYFEGCEDNLVQWLRQYSNDPQEQYLRGFLGRMLFSGDEVYKPVKVLSGGEKVRCMLSRMMLSGANVLLLDQPTNHLDLESIAALNNGLEAVKCNVLVSSHDHQLIQTVCNRVFDFTAEGKLIDRMMSYDEYLESQKPQG